MVVPPSTRLNTIGAWDASTTPRPSTVTRNLPGLTSASAGASRRRGRPPSPLGLDLDLDACRFLLGEQSGPETVAPRTSRTVAAFNPSESDMDLRTSLTSDAADPGTSVRTVTYRTAAPIVESASSGGSTRSGHQVSARRRAARRSGPGPGDEPFAEPVAGPRQAALDRPDRPAQVPGRLLVGASFEVAEDHRGPITLGEPFDLLVEHSRQVVAGTRMPDCFGGRRRLPFVPTPAGRGRPRHTRRSGRRPDGARGPGNPGPRGCGPSGPGPGRWPGRHPARRAGRSARPGRPGGPSGRAARPATAKASSAASPRPVAKRSRS